jgi:hypothetical protein
MPCWVNTTEGVESSDQAEETAAEEEEGDDTRYLAELGGSFDWLKGKIIGQANP